MAALRRFAAVGLFAFPVLLLPGSAAAVPVEVVYEFDTGVGFAGWGVGATTATGVAGATLTLLYDSGSPVISGFVGSPATLQRFVLTFTSPGTLMGDPFATLVVGAGAVGTQSVGGFWNFTGATAIAASAEGLGLPAYSQTGMAFLVIDVLGPGSIGFSGGGTQMFGGLASTASWTAGGLVGMEVSRTTIPEPTSGALLGLGFAALGADAWRRRRRAARPPN